MTSYRDAAITLWGEAGAYAHDSYARIRGDLYPELPAQLPIVIGLTAYGHCLGLTHTDWKHGPRISIFSPLFGEGERRVDDLLIHEMLHASLGISGLHTKHEGADWYAAVRRLSPKVLGRELDIRRGADRRSVRVPNPVYAPGGGQPKTLVRKQRDEEAVPHKMVAGWPGSFRPADYPTRHCIWCPTY